MAVEVAVGVVLVVLQTTGRVAEAGDLAGGAVGVDPVAALEIGLGDGARGGVVARKMAPAADLCESRS